MDERQCIRTCVWDSRAKSTEGTECHREICSWCHEVQGPELGTGPGRVTLSRKGRSIHKQGAVDGGHLRNGTENPLGQGQHHKAWVYLSMCGKMVRCPRRGLGVAELDHLNTQRICLPLSTQGTSTDVKVSKISRCDTIQSTLSDIYHMW